MVEKSDEDTFFEKVPALSIWYKAFMSGVYHFTIFIFIMLLFWKITSIFWLVAIPLQFFATSVSNVPFMYMFKNSDKIRERYLNKYKRNPWQHFWFHYSYTSPFGAVALYFPLLLKTDYFFPSVIDLPSNFLTQSLFPWFVALPLGVIIICFGILFVKPSQSFDGDMGNYLHIMDPNKNRLFRAGIYRCIRHPRFLSRLILSVGIAVIANNILAILAALTHFVPYLAFMAILDKEVIRMFGEDVKKYQKEVPALIPKYKNLKKFARILFRIKESKFL